MLFIKIISAVRHPAVVIHSHPEAMLRQRAAPEWLWITTLAQPSNHHRHFWSIFPRRQQPVQNAQDSSNAKYLSDGACR